MYSKKSFLFFFLFTLLGTYFLLTSPCFSEISVSPAIQKEFELWKEIFKKEALKKGVHEKMLTQVLPDLKLLENVLILDQKQNEFLLTFWDYTDKTISSQRVLKGKEMLREHASLLKEVSEKYNVPSHYIVAFWGLETNYGEFKGTIKTTDALATLAFDKRRRTFFTNELIALLKIMQEGEKTPFYGSWAGAFGNFQFMPSTYAAYAVDADKDGKKDIINSLPDAFASAANYLSQMGWDAHLKWGREVLIPQNLEWDKVHHSPRKTIAEWEKMGLVPADKKRWNSTEKDIQAKLIMPMGIKGPAFLTYSNFDRIMRWNNSTLYALSVGILSEKINSEKFVIHHKRINDHFSRADIKIMQKKLAKKGYYKGAIDGILGKGSKKALQEYQKKIHMPQDGYPNKDLYERLKKDN